MKAKIFYRKSPEETDRRVWVVDIEGEKPIYTEKVVIHGSIETFYEPKGEPLGYVFVNVKKILYRGSDMMEIATE